MIKEKKVIIEIDAEGNCLLEAHGFIGPECESALAEISKTLGAVKKQERTRDYYQTISSDTRQRIR